METESLSNTPHIFTPKTAPNRFNPLMLLGFMLLISLALLGGLYLSLKSSEPTHIVYTNAPTQTPIVIEVSPTVVENKFQQYTNDVYGFSFIYPKDWQVTEEFPNNIKVIGPNKHVLSIGYKRQNEKVRLTPTGAGAGTFVVKGTVDFNKQSITRNVLVSSNGVETDVFYNNGSEISANGDSFVFLLFSNDTKEVALDPTLQSVADSIVASFNVIGASPTIKF